MFLIDENLARRLVTLLGSRWPGASHVVDEDLDESNDADIWEAARQSSQTILTKDWDFETLAIARGAPPKVIIVAIGNCTTMQVANLMLGSADLIDEFLAGEEALLVLGR